MKQWRWYLLSFLIIGADQLSKFWALTALQPYEPQPIMPMLNFTLAFNSGAAFSFLNGAGEWHQWFFAIFAATMSAFIALWIARTPTHACLQRLSLSMILGGALGNLIDRLLVGHVIDFIDVYYQQYHWPIFNFADSAISCGAILLLIDLVLNPSAKKVKA